MRLSYSAVPFIFTVAPKGSTKRAIEGAIPTRSAADIVTGRLAEDESVPKAVITGCIMRLAKLKGELRCYRVRYSIYGLGRASNLLVTSQYESGSTKPP